MSSIYGGMLCENPHTLRETLTRLHAGQTTVFTNGCFDLLHGGHVWTLLQARLQGHALVVGVNTDDSVRHLKGPGRPVLPLGERMWILAALGCVDYVIPFAEDTPETLMEVLKPDVLVKGWESREAAREGTLPGRSHAGRVHIVGPGPYPHHTTSLIRKIEEAGRCGV